MGGKARPLVLCGSTHHNSDAPVDPMPAAPREPYSVSELQSLEALYAATDDFGWETWNVGPNNDPLERSQLAKSVPPTPRARKEATRTRGRHMPYASLESVDSSSNSHDTLTPKVRDTRSLPLPFCVRTPLAACAVLAPLTSSALPVAVMCIDVTTRGVAAWTTCSPGSHPPPEKPRATPCGRPMR